MRVTWQHAVGLAVLGLAALGLLVTPGAAVDRLATLLTSPWFPVVLVGLYLLRPLLAWPIAALAVLVGYRYGARLGVPLALTASVATSLLPYAAARRYQVEDGLLGRLAGGSRTYFGAAGDLRGVLAARLAPAPTEAVSIAAGWAEVPLPAFLLGTAIGQLPWTVVAVVAGHSMEHLATSGAGPSPWLLAAGTALGAVLLAHPLYRHFGGRPAPGEAAGNVEAD